MFKPLKPKDTVIILPQADIEYPRTKKEYIIGEVVSLSFPYYEVMYHNKELGLLFAYNTEEAGDLVPDEITPAGSKFQQAPIGYKVIPIEIEGREFYI